VNVGIEVYDTSINAAALVSISEAPFMKFPIQYMSNINCWLSMIPAPLLDSKGLRLADYRSTLSLLSLGIQSSTIRLNVSCISCSSPDMERLSELLNSSENVEEVTNALSEFMNFVTRQSNGNFVQDQLDRMLSKAQSSCPFHAAYLGPQNYQKSFKYPDPPVDDFGVLLTAGITVALLVLVGFIIRVIVDRTRKKRHKLWVESLSECDVNTYWQQQRMAEKEQNRLNESTTSLIASSSVPLIARVSIPIVILGSIALFMSGHLGLGASVNVHGSFAGQDFVLENFFSFSMSESITDMWESGAKELAVGLLIFSGIWPYVKQITTLCLWCMPPRWVSVSRRGSIFLWLDAFGKWSFIDIFVLIMSIASFRVSVNSPGFSFFPDKFYALDLFVVPQYGLYANMSAQLVSQVSSHFILYYHRKVIFDQGDHDSENPEGGSGITSRALHNHAFDRVGLKKGKVLSLYPIMNYVFIFVSFVTMLLVICGCVFSSFSLEVLGLLGIAVESGQGNERAYTSHNLFSIVQLLSEQASFLGNRSTYIGLGILSSVLIFTVFIVPLVQVMLIMMRWFAPLRKEWRYHISIAIEMLQAWQYMEVFILAVIAATWQLGSISAFMINDYCGGLEDVFASTLYYGILSESDAQCFRVSAEVKTGTWMLFAASIMLVFLNHFVGKASLDQEQDERRAISSAPNDLPCEEGVNQTKKDLDCGDGTIDSHSLVMPPPLFTDYYRFLFRSEGYIV